MHCELLLPRAVTRADPSKSAVISHTGKEYEKECVSVCVCVCVYIHIQLNHCCSAEINSLINQPYFNKIKFFKNMAQMNLLVCQAVDTQLPFCTKSVT